MRNAPACPERVQCIPTTQATGLSYINHQANYSTVNSRLISNFSIRFRNVALVMPRSLEA